MAFSKATSGTSFLRHSREARARCTGTYITSRFPETAARYFETISLPILKITEPCTCICYMEAGIFITIPLIGIILQATIQERYTAFMHTPEALILKTGFSIMLL